jgi:hypothetical protein
MKILRIAAFVPAIAVSLAWWVLLFADQGGALLGLPVPSAVSLVRGVWLASMAFFGVANAIASWKSGKRILRYAFLALGLVFAALFVLRLAGVQI